MSQAGVSACSPLWNLLLSVGLVRVLPPAFSAVKRCRLLLCEATLDSMLVLDSPDQRKRLAQILNLSHLR